MSSLQETSSNKNEKEKRVDFSNLLPQSQINQMVQEYMDLDHPSFDIGGLVVGSEIKTARLFLKSPGVFAGKPFFNAIFINQFNCRVEWHGEEGTFFDEKNKLHLATVTGPVCDILRGERTALNIISRCSGVATAARRAVDAVSQQKWKGHVAGTRKTTPGSFRLVEKYGLLVGGAATHRMDLSQMIMLKDNHIWAQNGNITKAVQLAKRAAGFSMKIEVECQNLEEAIEAAEAGADIVMLDNFEPEQLKRDAKTFKERFPHVLVEASGGITTETMPQYLSPHVDIISQGKLTHGYACLDFSLKIDK